MLPEARTGRYLKVTEFDDRCFQEQQCSQSSSNRQISESYGVWWQTFSGAAMLPEQLEPADIWKLRSLMTDVFRSSNAPRAAHNKRKYSPYHRRNHNWWVQWSCDRNFWIIDIKHENNIFSATVPSQKSDLMHWVPPITVTLTLQKTWKSRIILKAEKVTQFHYRKRVSFSIISEAYNSSRKRFQKYF